MGALPDFTVGDSTSLVEGVLAIPSRGGSIIYTSGRPTILPGGVSTNTRGFLPVSVRDVITLFVTAGVAAWMYPGGGEINLLVILSYAVEVFTHLGGDVSSVLSVGSQTAVSHGSIFSI